MTAIRMAWDAFADLEKRLKYRFGHKEEERSNHAVKIGAGEWRPSCPTQHNRIGWSGPPHDRIQSITCLDCGAFVTEDEMKDRGFKFDDCPDWVFFDIMEKTRERRLMKGDPFVFPVTR